MKFRKIPVVIDAIQFTLDNAREVANWCKGDLIDVSPNRPFIIIPTLEGRMRSNLGDWIIKGVRGEFYSCEKSIFEMTYEPSEDHNKAMECQDDD